MAKLRGTAAVLQLDMTGSGGWKNLFGIEDIQVVMNKDEIPVVNADTSSWKEFIAGDKESTIDVTIDYSESTTQAKLLYMAMNGGIIPIRYSFRKGVTASGYSSVAKVTSCSIDAPNGGLRTAKFTLRLTQKPVVVASMDTTTTGDTKGLLGDARGKECWIGFDADGTEPYTYIKLEKIETMSITFTNDEIDASDADSDNFKEFIDGDSSGEITATINYDPSSTVAAQVLTAYQTDTILRAQWKFGTATGAKVWTSTLITKQATQPNPAGSPQTVQLSFRIVAKPTEGTQ